MRSLKVSTWLARVSLAGLIIIACFLPLSLWIVFAGGVVLFIVLELVVRACWQAHYKVNYRRIVQKYGTTANREPGMYD